MTSGFYFLVFLCFYLWSLILESGACYCHASLNSETEAVFFLSSASDLDFTLEAKGSKVSELWGAIFLVNRTVCGYNDRLPDMSRHWQEPNPCPPAPWALTSLVQPSKGLEVPGIAEGLQLLLGAAS